jgi:hypothetical protein
MIAVRHTLRWFATICIMLVPVGSDGSERIRFLIDSEIKVITGEVVAEAEDGGLLLLGRDGQLWPLQRAQIRERQELEETFKPLGRDQVEASVLAELPAGFRVHRTAHYLVCYNTSPAFAQWWGALAEKLYRSFYGYWKHREMPLRPPRFPLVAIVFRSQADFVGFGQRELGVRRGQFIGHYSQQTNRVCTFDLTGIDSLANQRRPTTTLSHVSRLLAQPAAERTVATIIHEATHQLAFNSGLQTRYADNPGWVSEGIATYFESPNLADTRGWDGIGAINRFNLFHFRRSLAQQPSNRLVQLISSDAVFQDPASVRRAYAESWALTYFLVKTRGEQYRDYIKRLAEQSPLLRSDAQQRLALVRASFGVDLLELEEDWIRYMRKLK